MNVFVVIDSVDCAVDLLARKGDSLCRVGRFTTDTYKGRHDVKSIIRPRSIAIAEDKIIVLASAATDTSYLAVLQMVSPCQSKEDSLPVIAMVGFSCQTYAFRINPAEPEILVVGRNAVGYDIHSVSIANGVENICAATAFHYHVPKQAERIQESDPWGIGIACVAVAVVFLALLCTYLLLQGSGSSMMKIQNRRQKKGKAPLRTSKDDEIKAAIATAIYLYKEEMHDEEADSITIQKVERAWTPWNAKYYNMNHYSRNKR